jgi:hypothetical protein
MKKDGLAEVRLIRGTVQINIEVPKDVDDLVSQLCQLDGTSKREFYEGRLMGDIAGFLNTGEFLDTKGLAEKFRLTKHLTGLDPSMYGE